MDEGPGRHERYSTDRKLCADIVNHSTVFLNHTAHQRSQAVQLDELLYLSNHRAASNPLDVIYRVYGLVR
jgi:hypothetical protein